MHDPTWFANMERDYAEREERLDEARASLAAHDCDMQLRRELSLREVRWMCPYCYQEIDEHAPHCGEAGRAVPMTDEEEQ